MTSPVLTYPVPVSRCSPPSSWAHTDWRYQDRLPTVTASAALEELESDHSAYISTGLEHVDRALAGKPPGSDEGSLVRGGVRRGQVTEVWGPPGSGKTAFG